MPCVIERVLVESRLIECIVEANYCTVYASQVADICFHIVGFDIPKTMPGSYPSTRSKSPLSPRQSSRLPHQCNSSAACLLFTFPMITELTTLL